MCDENGVSEAKISVYEQDGEFYRHNDNLFWNRFQTVIVLEGAVLFTRTQTDLLELEQRIFMSAGFALVLLVCLLALKDQSDASHHLDRILQFEKLNGFKRSEAWPSSLRGGNLMAILLVALTLFNITFAIFYWNCS